jgi:hypothetical protein
MIMIMGRWMIWCTIKAWWWGVVMWLWVSHGNLAYVSEVMSTAHDSTAYHQPVDHCTMYHLLWLCHRDKQVKNWPVSLSTIPETSKVGTNDLTKGTANPDEDTMMHNESTHPLIPAVSMRTKNSATVCNMELRMKREGHGINLRLRSGVKEQSLGLDWRLPRHYVSRQWMKEMRSHQRSSSDNPSKSVTSSALVMDFTLVPAAVLQASKTGDEGEDNGNSPLLHLIYMP